jgi:hypothetical protein
MGSREREGDVGGGWVIGRKQRTTSGGWWLLRCCWWELGQHLRRKGVVGQDMALMGQQITTYHVMSCSFSLFFSLFYLLFLE